MEQQRRAPWKLVILVSLALLPVGILAMSQRRSDARPVSTTEAAPAAEKHAAQAIPPSLGPNLCGIVSAATAPSAAISTALEVGKSAPLKSETGEYDFLSDSPKTAATEEGIPWVRMIVGVLAVAMLIGVGIYMLKKANGGVTLRRDRHVKVVETRALGRKAQIHLVTIGGRALLLTSAGENVTKLAEFSEEELLAPEGAELESKAGDRDPGSLTFKSIVKNMVESCGSIASGFGSSKGNNDA